MVEHKILDEEEIEASTNRWRLVGLVLMALFVLAFPVYRLYEPAQRAEARTAQLQFLADQGAELFESNCSSCHGTAGGGGIAPALGSRDFLQSVDDQQIRELISLGIPGTEMVSYSNDFGGPMTDTQINAITVYLRSLEEEAVANPNWRTPLADENLTGQDIFVLACSRCHGIDLGGKEGDAPAIGPGSEAAEDSDARIAKRIREGKDEMPRFGRILTDEQIDMVIAYLREVQQGG